MSAGITGDTPAEPTPSSWRDMPLRDAVPFARLAIECAIRPLVAMAASLPEIIHFEIRERRDGAEHTKAQCSQKESAS